MSDKECQFPNCGKLKWARGYCGTHYHQLMNKGYVRPAYETSRKPGMRGKELVEWFWAQFERAGECLIWTKYCNPRGYGEVRWGSRARLVHRVAWELENGPIPDGMQIDHKCWNPACSEMTHLHVVDNKVNNENRNTKLYNTNTSGYRGVWWDKRTSKWSVSVTHNYHTYYAGQYEDIDDAVLAAVNKRAELFTNYKEAPEALEAAERARSKR